MADRQVLDLPDEFDRLLRQELSVEPSPAFAARLRERVTEQQQTPWWRARWIPAVGSLATVASIAVALVIPSVARWTSAPVAPAPPAVRVAAIQHPEPAPAALRPRSAPAVRVSSTGRSAPRVQTSELPVVIVDGRQRAALTALFKMMDEGRVTGDSFARTIAVSMEPIAEQVGAIIVAPVVVSAIARGGVLPNSER